MPECEAAQIPKVKTRDASDIDYTATWFYIDTKSGQKGILRGRGPMYSWGAPLDSLVWTAVEYTEFMYEDGMIDARGHNGQGSYWRSRTMFGAAAFYTGADKATAELLDCVMDRLPLKVP
jgi:hypothetical protein